MRLFQSMRITSSKPKWAALCSEVYKDKKGYRYYKYNDTLDMCVLRKGEIEKALIELSYGSDFEDVLNELKIAINKPNKQGKMQPDIVGMGYLVNELTDRQTMLLVPDILMKVCANVLLREDENPYIVDQEILAQKVETFKSEIERGGLFDFFQLSGTLKLLGLSHISTTDLTKYIHDSKAKMLTRKATRAYILDNKLQHGWLVNENTYLTK